MQIFIQSSCREKKSFPFDVKTRTFTLEVESSCTVENMKEKIRHQEGIMPELQHMEFPHRDGTILADYGVQNGSTVRMSVGSFTGDWRLNILYPELGALARKQKLVKMICRKCYGQLPYKATNCHKKKCGGCGDVRKKHGYQYRGRKRKYTWLPDELDGSRR